MITVTYKTWHDFIVKADASDKRLGQYFCDTYHITDDELFNEEKRGKTLQIIFTKYAILDMKDEVNRINKEKAAERRKKAAAKKKVAKKKTVKKKTIKKKR